MKILITGGTGFIGRPILDFALEKGHRVVLLDYEGKEKIVHKHLKVFVGDFENRVLPSQDKTFKLDNTKIQKVLGFVPEYGKKEYLKDLSHKEF